MTHLEVLAHEERIARGKQKFGLPSALVNAVMLAGKISTEATFESELHYAIIAECKARGWIYFHGSMAHKARRTVGEPDFTILADKGRVFFVEAKTRTGKLSPEQLALKVWAEKLGHTIHTVRSLPEFLELTK